MADDKSKSGAQDRARINVNQGYELRDWSTKFGACDRTCAVQTQNYVLVRGYV